MSILTVGHPVPIEFTSVSDFPGVMDSKVVVADVAGERSHLGELAVEKTAKYITFCRSDAVQPLLVKLLFQGEISRIVQMFSTKFAIDLHSTHTNCQVRLCVIV